MKELMKKNLNVIVTGVLVLTAILVVIFAVPAKETSKGSIIEKQASENIPGETGSIEGIFIPKENDLQSISLIVNRSGENRDSATITLEILQDGDSIASCTRPMSEMERGYMNEFQLDCKLVAGKEYTYYISFADCQEDYPTVDMGTFSCGPAETMTCTVNGTINNGMIPLLEYRYQVPMNWESFRVYLVCICIAGILLILASGNRKKRSFTEKTAIYLFGVVIGITLILLQNEGIKPLDMKGTEMIHSVGGEDYRGYLTIDTSSEYSGLLAKSKEYMLNRGTYILETSYLTDTNENSIEVYNDGNKIMAETLLKADSFKTSAFTLEEDAQNVEIRVYYSGAGTLKLNHVSMIPEKSFYTDAYFFVFLFVLLNLAAILVYVRNKRKPIRQETLVSFCIMAGLALFATYPFFQTGMAGGDDLCYHLLRIEGIKDGIRDGQFPVVIMPNALGGNGYLNSMYPYLFLYIPAVMRLFGVSLTLSYKFLIFTANAATIGLTFTAIRSISRTRYAAILGTALYVLLPYRFTNIYARGALGEALALTFIPILIAGFYHVLFGDKKKWYYLLIGFTGVLQSHILSFVLMLLIFGVCGLIYIKDFLKEKRLLVLLKAAIYTVVLNLWFVVPFVWFYLKENLGTGALSWSNYEEYSVNPSYFAGTISLSSARYLSFGIPVLLCFMIGIIKLVCERKKDEEPGGKDSFLTYLFVVGMLMTFMITGYFASWKFMELVPFKKLFQLIQFPWRLFGPVSAMVIFAAVLWLEESRILHHYKTAIFALLIGCNLFTGMTVAENNENFTYYSYDDTYSTGHEVKLRGILPSDATIRYPYEWRIGGLLNEEMIYQVYPSDYDNTEVISYEKKGTNAVLTYCAPTADSYVELPIMNYYGYHAEDENGNTLAIATGNGSSMRIPLVGDGMEHQLIISYRMPGMFTAATWISAAGALFMLIKKIVSVLRLRKTLTV